MWYEKSNKLIALADCNNFYASCERCFNPRLNNKPIVILSNNDGCVIARSAEAKKIGIPMGIPFFEIRDQVERHKIITFSSNFALYGDLSARVMECLKGFALDMEIYSIDEAFFTLPQEQNSLTKTIPPLVKQHTGVPISIGLSTSKTLAKVAAKIAKQKDGFYQLDPKHCEHILQNYPISDIWGVGKRLSLRLNKLGIRNAWQLRNIDDSTLLKRFGVCLLRTAQELRGEYCFELNAIAKAKQSIGVSRTFPKTINNQDEIASYLSFFTERACEKLRKEKQKALYIKIFLQGSFKDKSYYSHTVRLAQFSDFTPNFIKATQTAIKIIFYRQNIRKAGVLLTDFCPRDAWQQELFSPPVNTEKETKLMQVMDNINQKFGSQTLSSLSALRKSFPRGAQLSPPYTSSWDQLPRVF